MEFEVGRPGITLPGNALLPTAGGTDGLAMEDVVVDKRFVVLVQAANTAVAPPTVSNVKNWRRVSPTLRAFTHKRSIRVCAGEVSVSKTYLLIKLVRDYVGSVHLIFRWWCRG
jgi:hypothetical protein